ncbi:hypothetical protein [Caulobacter radicis]|uniref:hypothetical protein n=1 Tax=Caulobacter radicis TaxID=2172650 RepID=UPI001A9C52EC|nr:hypothetical protein [Caulobacter radicis]
MQFTATVTAIIAATNMALDPKFRRIIIPRGLNRTESANYIGISPSKFDSLVKDGRMPRPEIIDCRRVWDTQSLDAHFDDLPTEANDNLKTPGIRLVAHFKYQYIHAFRDRHGNQRYYFRKSGQRRIAIHGLPESQEFHAAYQAALSGITAPTLFAGERRTTPGSMQALITAYYQSGEFIALSDSTKKTYRGIIDRIRDEHGHKLVRDLEPKHVWEMRDQRSATPSAANTYIRMLRILMRFAIYRDMRSDDPTAVVKKIKNTSSGFRSWTEEDIAKF